MVYHSLPNPYYQTTIIPSSTATSIIIPGYGKVNESFLVLTFSICHSLAHDTNPPHIIAPERTGT